MVKIVMITGSYPPDKCGVGDYTKLLANNLVKQQIDLNIITSCKKIDNNEHITINNEIDDWSIKNLNKILKVIENINPDIVHIQYPTKGYGRKIAINILPMLLKLKRYKVITTLHEYSDNSKLGKIRANFNIMFSDFIIVVDPRYQCEINGNKLFKHKKIKYINIASNIPISTISKEEQSKKRYQIVKDSKKKIMAYFGFVNEKKGIESILLSMKMLKDKNKLNLVFVLIAEINKLNKYHHQLLKLIDDLGLKDNILITGYLNEQEVSNYLKISDFVVLPFTDGFSPKNGSVLAALQEGKIVITTKSKLLKQHFNNLLFIDRYDYIDKLTEMIDILQNQHGENDKIESDMFNWTDIAMNHSRLYKKISDSIT